MAFWDKWFGNVSEQPSESIDRPTFLIYILLPEPLQPLERGSRYEDPLEAELQLAGVGFVSGGGSSLGPEGADGSAEIEFCGVDVERMMLMRLSSCSEYTFSNWAASKGRNFRS